MAKLEKAQSFWQWFEKHQQVLVNEFSEFDALDDQDDPSDESYESVEKVLGQIMDELHKYDERLFPYCGIDNEGKVELIVTAEGNVDAFKSAHELIATAPNLNSWKFTALKPRSEGEDADFVTHSMDGEATQDIIKYSIATHEGEVLLILVFDIEEAEIEEELAFLGVNMVESLLGEQDLATGFDGIDVMTSKQFAETGQGWELSELSNLAAEFDKRRIH